MICGNLAEHIVLNGFEFDNTFFSLLKLQEVFSIFKFYFCYIPDIQLIKYSLKSWSKKEDE